MYSTVFHCMSSTLLVTVWVTDFHPVTSSSSRSIFYQPWLCCRTQIAVRRHIVLTFSESYFLSRYKPYDSQVLWINHLNSVCASLALNFPRSTLVWAPGESVGRPVYKVFQTLLKSMVISKLLARLMTFLILKNNCWEMNWCLVSILHDFLTIRGLVQAVKDLHLIHIVHQQGKINILDFPGRSLRHYSNRCVGADKFSWFLFLKQCCYAIRKTILKVSGKIPQVWK